MASDDRERTFEKALARHLRPFTSSSPDGGGLAGARADLCPDPELLAAYHDGSLSQEERNLWKQHVVGCDRCQFVLAGSAWREQYQPVALKPAQGLQHLHRHLQALWLIGMVFRRDML